MKNKNTIIIILLVVIIIILGYVAFLKPKNVNNNYQPQENQKNINNIPNIKLNTTTDSLNDPQNYQSFNIVPIPSPIEDPHVLSAIQGAKIQSANFAGHYVVVMVGCGTECAGPALYDKNSGKIYRLDPAMLSGALGVEGMEGIVFVDSSVSNDILSLKKKAVDGTIYMNQWKLIGDTFVEVQ